MPLRIESSGLGSLLSNAIAAEERVTTPPAPDRGRFFKITRNSEAESPAVSRLGTPT